MCKKQTAVSHSSTESEIISLDAGLRLDGLPALELWDLIVSVLGNVSRVSDRSGQPEMFERFGLTAQCLGCRANRTGIGYPANHTERCRERIEQELEKKPEGAWRVARDRERIKRARHKEKGRDMS